MSTVELSRLLADLMREESAQRIRETWLAYYQPWTRLRRSGPAIPQADGCAE